MNRTINTWLNTFGEEANEKLHYDESRFAIVSDEDGEVVTLCSDWDVLAQAESEQALADLLKRDFDAETDDTFEVPDDTPSLQNCDDYGTGEGRYHGRM